MKQQHKNTIWMLILLFLIVGSVFITVAYLVVPRP